MTATKRPRTRAAQRRRQDKHGSIRARTNYARLKEIHALQQDGFRIVPPPQHAGLVPGIGADAADRRLHDELAFIAGLVAAAAQLLDELHPMGWSDPLATAYAGEEDPYRKPRDEDDDLEDDDLDEDDAAR